MTKNSQKQSGSAVVIISIIAVIALLGALGFILWQNVLSKDSESSNTANSTTTEQTQNADDYVGWETYQSDRDGYSIKYPNDWIVIKETDEDGPYIRNLDPTANNTEGGYPEGYINVRILSEENNANFKAMTGYTTTQWYDALGSKKVNSGAVSYTPDDVKETTVNGMPAKSAKSVFTETNEVIYFLEDDTLYSINLYPYGVSSDPTVKLIIDSFSINN